MKALKMAVVFGECGRECLSGPGNTEVFSVLAGRGGDINRFQKAIEATHTHQTDRSLRRELLYSGGGCHFSGRFIFARSVFDAQMS